MSKVGQKEIQTQRHVIQLFTNDLGYRYLGHWKDRETNANVEEELLSNWLEGRGRDRRIIGRVLFEMNKAEALGGGKALYDANREAYSLLRYGVKVRPEVGERTELDEQIEKVFKGVDEEIHRARSGEDLIRSLNDGGEWLIGSLIHKFGGSEEGDADAYIQDLESHLIRGFYPKGRSSSSWTNATGPSPDNSIRPWRRCCQGR